MSQYFANMLVCDYCLPGVAPTVINGVFDVEFVGRGLCIGIPLNVAEALGWRDEDGMTFCPSCVKKIELEDAAEEGTEHGAFAMPQGGTDGDAE